MSDPHQIVHFINTERIQQEQADSLSRLSGVLEYQAESARRSQRAAWWVSLASVVIAGGSLAVAILALTIG